MPRQHSSGGKQRPGRASKAGWVDIRRLLIIGAMSRLSWLGRKSKRGNLVGPHAIRKPRMLVAVALANKLARVDADEEGELRGLAAAA
ncbi:transposase [Bradyrhizobium sp. 137]|uniref:transposase n=1 Tax=Bradyrhizobium sp. 137 TaxID=2782614 RepID=UPI001FF9403B|nr:transposase [Bradyrhizobium sp. 137]